jgi:hypothetical protein
MELQGLLWHWIISCGELLYYQHWNFINWYSIYTYTSRNLHTCPPEGWRCVRDYCSWAEDYTAEVWKYFTANDLLNVKLTCRQTMKRLYYSLFIHCSPISERTLLVPRSRAAPKCPPGKRVCRWRWVWITCEMIMTGETWSTQRKFSPSATPSTTNPTRISPISKWAFTFMCRRVIVWATEGPKSK